jgi:starvation-inducible DNA-binding protein
MSENALNVGTQEIPLESGIDRSDRKALADKLNRFLASTAVLNAKTQAVHWLVEGPMFYSVHKLTEEHYEDMQDAIDDIAERVRALGFFPLPGLAAFLQESEVPELDTEGTVAEMVTALAEDHQTVARLAREIVGECDEADDVFTADMLTTRIGVHEKASWMLNALRAQ